MPQRCRRPAGFPLSGCTPSQVTPPRSTSSPPSPILGPASHLTSPPSFLTTVRASFRCPHPLDICYSTFFFLSFFPAENQWKSFKAKINDWRTESLGISAIQAAAWEKLLLEHIPISYGTSPSLFEKPSDWPSQVDVAGYWFLETKKELKSRKKAIHPLASVPESIVQFINSGPFPVFIGFDPFDFQHLSQEDRSKFFNTIVECLNVSFSPHFLALGPTLITPSRPPYLGGGSAGFSLLLLPRDVVLHDE